MKKIINIENIIPFLTFTSLLTVELIFNSIWVTTGFAVLAAASCYWSKFYIKQKIKKSLGLTSNGNLINELDTVFTSYKNGMSEAADLVSHLGKEGDREFNSLKEDTELAQAILTVDNQIKEFNTAESKRKWKVEGLAKFSELLRSHDATIENLSTQLISGLVNYIEANQGGIFLHKKEGDEDYLELTGCYAYDKKKIREKKVNIGQGMLGQCFLERETLYLLDVPTDYVEITSGLGEATPSNLVIVPLIVNEKIFGVMEFATFIPLKKYQVDFLEQVAENIASVFASLMTASHTKTLLDDSQKLTVELQSREEEMRQNMEELSATQEEMERKQVELDGLVGAINNTLGLAELDSAGGVIFSNDIFKNILKHNDESITSVNYKQLTGLEDVNQEFLSRINSEQLASGDYKTENRNGELLWLNMSFSPIVDNEGATKKILVLVQDITEGKLEEIEFEKLSLVADNTDNSVIITDNEGRIEYVNHGFCDMTGYSEPEVLGKKPGDFLQGEETNKETVDRIAEGLRSKKPVYEEILNYTKSGDSYWISMAINPVINDEGELDKYISIQANITETKKSALDFSYKLKAISKSNAIIEFDTKGNIIEVNDNFLNIVGYERDEVIGQHHRIFATEKECNSESYRKFWEKLGKGEYISDEFERVDKNGNTVWLKGIYNPIYDINGNPYKIVKFAVEITKQKQLKLETQKQEAELSSQLDAINKTIASVEFDMNGNLKDANDIFLSITGIQKDELIGLHYFDIIPEADQRKPQTELMWQNLRDGKFFSGEFKFKDHSGKELWLKGTFNPINDLEGNPYKIMMYAQFNTSEKEKQKNLTGTVNALKNTTPILELNPDGTFKNANQLFFDQFKYKRLELRKKPFNEFLVEGKGMPSTKEIFKTIDKASFVEYDLNYLDSQGNSKTFRTTFSPITDLEDNLSKIVVILIDRAVVLKV